MEGGGQGGGAGSDADGGRSRYELRKFLVQKDTGSIPDTSKMTHRLCCHEVHPGVCCTRDAAVFDDCLLMATSLERALASEHLYRFVRLAGTAQQNGQDSACRPPPS